jgi:hypothetical protein
MESTNFSEEKINFIDSILDNHLKKLNHDLLENTQSNIFKSCSKKIQEKINTSKKRDNLFKQEICDL